LQSVAGGAAFARNRVGAARGESVFRRNHRLHLSLEPGHNPARPASASASAVPEYEQQSDAKRPLVLSCAAIQDGAALLTRIGLTACIYSQQGARQYVRTRQLPRTATWIQQQLLLLMRPFNLLSRHSRRSPNKLSIPPAIWGRQGEDEPWHRCSHHWRVVDRRIHFHGQWLTHNGDLT